MHYEFWLRRGRRLLSILGVMFFTLALLGLSASPAFAQTDRYDCPDFDFQEDAQRIYDQNPSDPYGLDDDNDGIACESLPSRGDSPTGDQYDDQTNTQQADDLDCADFSTRGQAQAEFAKDRSDPNNLDADNDGQACEDFDYGSTTSGDTTNAAQDSTADREGSFRCEFFLHVVRDDRGALRAQYQGDELIVQRFEQCLSEDVLADTIPNRNLPFTGGMSLLFLGAIGLAAIVAGVSVLRAVMRRTG
jgi:hypothetical protein